jgi:hypothetical protein
MRKSLLLALMAVAAEALAQECVRERAAMVETIRACGGLRREGLARTSDEAAALLGGKRDAREGLRGHERDAFTEWSAIVLSLPGVSHWSPAQRRGLLDVIKARGGRTERAYVEALQRAPWVVDALAALAKDKRPVS